ncbi:hypothetical protein FOVSG1_003891 [Fusarium oxysporum f. sp. vasinfectum]
MPGIILHLSADDLEQLFDRKLKEVLDEVLAEALAEALQPIHSKLDAIEEKLEKLTARLETQEDRGSDSQGLIRPFSIMVSGHDMIFSFPFSIIVFYGRKGVAFR